LFLEDDTTFFDGISMLFYAENLVKMDRIFCLLIGREIIMVQSKKRMKIIIFSFILQFNALF